MSVWFSLLNPILILRPGLGFDADTIFSGSLERVGNTSISVRLEDRRIIDAMVPNTQPLDAVSIASRYNRGDRIEVTVKAIQPVWEQGTSRYQSLEITSIRLIRRPSPEELSKMYETVPFREGKNLLKLPTPISTPIQVTDSNGPGSEELALARRVNLDYAANMPNFVADETARRYRSSPQSSNWRDFDIIESEIAFTGNHANRQRIRRNGKSWDQPFEALPGFKWYEGFGTEIVPLFDPKCPTTITYQDRSRVGKRMLLDYRFSTPVDGCFPFFFFGYQRYNPSRTGHVFIDDSTGNIIQLDEEASGFPAEIEFSQREEHITWDYVKIGEDSHLLPVRANFLVRYYDGTRYRIEVQYQHHRHFEASTNVTFQ
jgi:hypothetical protein